MIQNVLHRISCIPPIPARRLIPPVMLLGAWLLLSGHQEVLAMMGLSAFILANIAMQVARASLNLPRNLTYLSEIGVQDVARYGRYAIGFTVGLAALQIWCGSALLSQRLVTLFGLFVIANLAFGLLRNRSWLDMLPWRGRSVSERQGHLARMAILVELLRIGINEAAIAMDSLTVWISIQAITPMILHVFYWILLLMTMPVDEEPQP